MQKNILRAAVSQDLSICAAAGDLVPTSDSEKILACVTRTAFGIFGQASHWKCESQWSNASPSCRVEFGSRLWWWPTFASRPTWCQICPLCWRGQMLVFIPWDSWQTSYMNHGKAPSPQFDSMRGFSWLQYQRVLVTCSLWMVCGSKSHCLYCLNYSGAWGLTVLTVFVSSGKELRQLSVFSKTFGLPKHVKDGNGRSTVGIHWWKQTWVYTSLSTSLSWKPGVFFVERRSLQPAPAPRGASLWDSAGAIAELRSLQVFHRSGASQECHESVMRASEWTVFVTSELLLLQPQPMNINEHQWTSMNINEHQWTSMNINEHQWTSVNISEHQWTRSIKLGSGLNHDWIMATSSLYLPEELESSVMSMLPELYRQCACDAVGLRIHAVLFWTVPFPLSKKVNRHDTRLDIAQAANQFSSLLEACKRSGTLLCLCETLLAYWQITTVQMCFRDHWDYTLAPFPEGNCQVLTSSQ